MTQRIGTLNETSLHAALKKWYAQPGDKLEVSIDGFQIDIVRENLLIEIQVKNFSAIRHKLQKLIKDRPVRLVYPLTQEKWLTKKGEDGKIKRRKSPKKGVLEQMFMELVSFPKLLLHPNFSMDVLFIQEEEVRLFNRKPTGWRRKDWKTEDRHLLKVVGQRLFETVEDIAPLIPPHLVAPFTTRELSTVIAIPLRLAQKMAYCLREMGVIASTGKLRNAILYTRNC